MNAVGIHANGATEYHSHWMCELRAVSLCLNECANGSVHDKETPAKKIEIDPFFGESLCRVRVQWGGYEVLTLVLVRMLSAGTGEHTGAGNRDGAVESSCEGGVVIGNSFVACLLVARKNANIEPEARLKNGFSVFCVLFIALFSSSLSASFTLFCLFLSKQTQTPCIYSVVNLSSHVVSPTHMRQLDHAGLGLGREGTALHMSKMMEWQGGDPRLWAELWLREKGIERDSRRVMSYRC